MPYFQGKSAFPLYGNPFRFIFRVWKNGLINRRRAGAIVVFFLNACRIFPGGLWERLWHARAISRISIEQPPVFILGHYRSGTTFLHKLLASDPQFACIRGADFAHPFASTRFINQAGNFWSWVFKKLKVQNTHFNNYILDLNDPIDDGLFFLVANVSHTVFWEFVFPHNAANYLGRYVQFQEEGSRESWKQFYKFVLQRMSWKNKGKRILSKNPPNTGRVKALVELFPDAKFVYLHRNPLDVYSSAFHLVKNTVVSTYTLQEISLDQLEEDLFIQYRTLIDLYETEKELVPPENLIEWKYEDLMVSPLEMVRKLYGQFQLGDFEEVLPHFQNFMKGERSYKPREYNLSAKTLEKIERELGPYFKKGGYVLPKGVND